jgi:FixJ family two-component response regulator
MVLEAKKPDMFAAPTIFVIDDDDDVRTSLSRLLRAAGWQAETFASAGNFLERPAYAGTGCVLLDVDMPEMTGPRLHETMLSRGIDMPVIFLTGKGDVPTTVQAMKRGAIDFLLKPVENDALFAAIEIALQRHACDQAHRREQLGIATRLARLSAREREVMERVILGRLNKQIAAELGIAEKTVKIHRGRVMEKMEVQSVAALVHLLNRAGDRAPAGDGNPPLQR